MATCGNRRFGSRDEFGPAREKVPALRGSAGKDGRHYWYGSTKSDAIDRESFSNLRLRAFIGARARRVQFTMRIIGAGRQL